MHIEGLDDLTPIGSGGFSQVFRATETIYDRTVAAKVLNFVLDDPDDQARFEQECRAMAQLSDHPNIVPLYSTTYTDDGYPVIVMEFFAGGTLWARARRGASLAELLSVGVKMCSALQTAHQRNVTHRDVKPQNVLVSRFGEPGLTDFGISAFDRHHADHGKPRGITVAYAAPEALNGGVSPRTDVYSLAATLYTVLADQRPFDLPGKRQSAAELARRITTEDPPSLREFGYSTAVDQAVRGLGMARTPSQRPATAAQFGEILRTLERREGFEPTPWIEAADMTLDNSAPTLLDQTEASAVIHLPTSTADEAELARPADESTGTRRTTQLVAGLIVAALVLGLIVLAARGEPDQDLTAPAPLPTVVDDFYDTPAEPEDLMLLRTADGIRLSWVDVNDDPVLFGIQATRNGALVGEEQLVEGTSLDFDPGDETCFTMRAVGPSQRGKTSLDVEPVCLRDTTPFAAAVNTERCVRPCELVVTLVNPPQNPRVSVTLIAAELVDVDDARTSVELDADGSMVLAIEEALVATPGRYEIRIVSPQRAAPWLTSVEVEA